MLDILLCTGRGAHVDDYANPYGLSSGPGSKRSFGGSTKRKVSKIQIGSPTDFRHESHMGYDDVANLDTNQFQREFKSRMENRVPGGPPPPRPSRPQMAEIQIQPIITTNATTNSSPSSPVRRKAAPTSPSSQPPSPTTHRSSTASYSNPNPNNRRRESTSSRRSSSAFQKGGDPMSQSQMSQKRREEVEQRPVRF